MSLRRPACMSDEEWALWQRSNSEWMPWPKMQAKSPCADCRVEFAREMRDEERCDGEPGVVVGRPRVVTVPA